VMVSFTGSHFSCAERHRVRVSNRRVKRDDVFMIFIREVLFMCKVRKRNGVYRIISTLEWTATFMPED
jgi:hypothetical protein